jgi:antitoxin HigA-1
MTMLQHAAHPGEVLKDELEELGITPTELARQIDVPANRMSQIIQGKRSITGDTALRLGHWFKTDPQFWMNLQAQFELVAAQEAAGKTIQALPTRPTEQGASTQPR